MIKKHCNVFDFSLIAVATKTGFTVLIKKINEYKQQCAKQQFDNVLLDMTGEKTNQWWC